MSLTAGPACTAAVGDKSFNGQFQQNSQNGHFFMGWCGVYAKNIKLVEPVKVNWKKSQHLKIYGKNKIFCEKWAKMANFLCIFGWNGGKTLKLFLLTPALPWLACHKDFHNFNSFRKPKCSVWKRLLVWLFLAGSWEEQLVSFCNILCRISASFYTY